MWPWMSRLAASREQTGALAVAGGVWEGMGGEGGDVRVDTRMEGCPLPSAGGLYNSAPDHSKCELDLEKVRQVECRESRRVQRHLMRAGKTLG